MSTPGAPPHSANQSAASSAVSPSAANAATATTATASPSPSSSSSPGQRPAGILPMPAQLMAAAGAGAGGASTAVGPVAKDSSASGTGSVPTTGGGDNAAEGPMQTDINNMANTKEKTPMCLLNELARFNKLQPKYELVSEKGPPHEKTFSVCLTLGTQRYEAQGASIKKAQHSAAATALEKCMLPQPIPRNNPKKFKRHNITPNTDAMTPTVKLNSLAMKTGRQVHYIPLNPLPPRPFYGYRGPRNQGMPTPPPHGGMPHPNQQGQGGPPGPPGPQGHHPPPPFPPQGSGQMTSPPPLSQHQGGPVAPPPGISQPLPQGGPGGVNQHGPPPPAMQGPPSPQPQPQTQQDGGANQLQTQGQGQAQAQGHGQGQQHHPGQQGPGHPPYPNQQHRPYYPRYQRPYVHFVKVTVGDREFVGEGKTQKGARQNAAYRALSGLENEPVSKKVDQATTTNVVVDGNGDAGSSEDRNVKSDISLVYEAANLHDLNVVFKVLEECGQPHLKIFKLQCIVGEFTTDAEGPSKKEAKRRAAELMLPKLKELPPVPAKIVAQHHMQRKLWRQDKNKKKKSKSLLKTSPTDPNFGAPGLHPVSRLVQILQAKNEREPEFSVIEERPLVERAGPHMIRRREFTMQVSAASQTATGKGKTKKDAKKLAAENMLKLLGYAPTPEEEMNGVPGSATQPSKSALKTTAKNAEETDRKVTFKEDKQKSGGKPDEAAKEGSGGIGQSKGLAPGLLPIMPGMNAPPPSQQQQQPSQMFPSGPAPPSGHKLPNQGLNRAPGAPVSNSKISPKSQALRDIAQDLLSLGHSPTAEALLKGAGPAGVVGGVGAGGVGAHTIPNLARASQQLEYLANVSSLSLKYNDFPKGNKAEYQTVVYLNTEPQSAFRGTGATVEASHDSAAITALRSLAGITDGDGGKKSSGR